MTRRWAAQQLLDLGDGRAKLKRLPGIAERDISGPVKKLLAMHKNVAWALRCQTGSGYLVDYATMRHLIAEIGGEAAFEARFGRLRWLEFGGEGAPDYVGQLRDARCLGIEVKKQKYVPSEVTPAQRSFLGVMSEYGALAFVGSDIARIEAILSGRVVPEDSGGFLI